MSLFQSLPFTSFGSACSSSPAHTRSKISDLPTLSNLRDSDINSNFGCLADVFVAISLIDEHSLKVSKRIVFAAVVFFDKSRKGSSF